jgi:hypothetical protein
MAEAIEVGWPQRPGGDARELVEPRLPPFTGALRPLVDAVARIKASVHAKLLVGFLTGALLLLGMGVLSLVVIERMSQRVAELGQLQEKVDRSRQMEYLVTAQSHWRAARGRWSIWSPRRATGARWPC